MSGKLPRGDIPFIDSRVNQLRKDTDASIASLIAADAALTADVATRALKATTITGGGIASGGGDLSANRTITVTAATGAEAVAGTNNTKAVTPLALASAIATRAAVVHAHAISDVTGLATALSDKDLVLLGTYTYSGAVATVDFIGLSAYSYIEAHLDEISCNNNDNLWLRLSNDNGGSFHTSGYASIANNATASAAYSVGNGIALTRGYTNAMDIAGVVRIYQLNNAGKKSRADTILHSFSSELFTAAGKYDTAEANNALRFLWSGGSNFDKGTITLYGRK